MRHIYIIATGLFILLCNVAVVLAYRYERRPRRSDCADNLREIVEFMSRHGDDAWRLDRSATDFPARLLALASATDKGIGRLRKSFFCPFCRGRCDPSECTYEGPSMSSKIKNPNDWGAAWPILWDKPGNHPDGVHVVYYRDGAPQVKFISNEEFDELHKKLDAELAKYAASQDQPQNPQ